MSLNIKNPGTTALVRQLAQRTGLSQTQAVETAVREKLASLDARPAAEATEETRAVAAELLMRIRDGLTEADLKGLEQSAADLYDDDGLPR